MEKQYKVLSIDDDQALTELLTLLLGTHGYHVRAANSGEAGLQIIREWQPDVVLLDLMMPDMDGWETCRRIREFSDVPVIVLSALDSPGLVARALDAGADDYLTKPVPSNLLVAHINRLLRRREGFGTGSLALRQSQTSSIS